MITQEQLEKYIIYIKAIQKQLDTFFEEQAPYIHCKNGCSHCCEKGEYPYSELEFSFLMAGAQTLPPETVKIIDENIIKLKEAKAKNTENKFLHACPFLINHSCSLYQYRGIVCRSHGLAFFSQQNKLLVPACSDLGLNYAEVYDFDTHMISEEKFKQTGYTQEPLAHNVGHHFLTHNSLTETLNLDFGDVKTMADWLEI